VVDDRGNGEFRLVNPNSGKCVDVTGNGTSDGTAIQLWSCHDGGAQRFRLEGAGGVHSRLINPQSGKCLDVNGNSAADGAKVQIWSCNNSDAQAWELRGLTGGDGDGDGDVGGDGDEGDSDLLVPAQGALIGQYYGDQNIQATAAKLGRTLPLHLTYYDFKHDWVGSVTKADIAAGRIPFVNWEAFDTPLDEIIAGQHDAMLAKRAQAAKALGAKFFVDFGAEMNGEWSPWGGAQNGKSPAKYIAAYRHVHDALKDVDNAVWVWCPNVTDEPRASWNRAMDYYPGDAYVDWTCVDGYNWGNTNGGSWQSFKDVFKNIYPQLAAKNKPIMIGEMASAELGGDKAAWIDAMIPVLRSDYPLIKGLIWFDINKETDWRISSSARAEAAFKRMVNDPFFNP
jgi:hypothetical protein